MSRESNSTAEVTLNGCSVVHTDGSARTATERMWAVARYYDISSKADRGDIFIIHDQKLSYRTPLIVYLVGLGDISHAIVMRISSLKPVL